MRVTSSLIVRSLLAASLPLAAGIDAAVAASVAQSTPQIAPPAAGLARVWVLRQWDPINMIGDPLVYANDTPLAPALAGTAYYRDLSPGTYNFTVASCGTDVYQNQVVTIAPGSQTPLEIQVLRSNAPADCMPGATFYVRQIPPAWADMYFNQLAYLGPR